MSYFSNSTVNIGWNSSPNLDAFSRVRVSNPQSIFDCQFTYGLAPLLYEPLTSSATTTTITHDTTNRLASMKLSSSVSGSFTYMQTYEHFRYQPGKSQLVFITFNMIESSSGVVKLAGYSDGNNGIEFQLSGSVKRFVIRSTTDDGWDIIPQSSWNIDKLDSFGRSGYNLDISKVQILVIDFQALYVGRVRVGFDLNGDVIYCHEFNHANLRTFPYMQSANLPVRAGMFTAENNTTTTMSFICSSVSSEGGQEETTGYGFSISGSGTAGNQTRAHILSIRPKTTFNSIVNRSKFILESVEVLVTGTPIVYWELVIGQAISGATTFNDVNTTYSAMEFNSAGTISGSPAIVITSGYTVSSTGTKSQTSTRVPLRYPITLNSAGQQRLLGTLSLIATGLTNTSAMSVSFNWRELR